MTGGTGTGDTGGNGGATGRDGTGPGTGGRPAADAGGHTGGPPGTGTGARRVRGAARPPQPEPPGGSRPPGPADDGRQPEPIPPGEGRRLHPVTPWRRAWAPMAGLGALSVQDPQRLRALAELGAGPLLAITALVLAVATLYGFLSWRVTRYLVTDTELRIRTGLLFRRTAHLRLDRIQSIDITRPLLARALGVAKLKMDVVGAGSADELAFVGEAEAVALRAELLARAAGIAPDAAPTTGEAPARSVFQVDTRMLVWGLALLVSGWGTLLAALAIAPLMWLGTSSVFVTVVTTLPLLATAWRSTAGAFLTQYGWTVAESPDGMRLDHGLLQREHATVPPGRVQSVRIVEPLLWRGRGWARVELEVAGEGNRGGLLLPVATRAECVSLIGRFLPHLDVAEAVAAVRPAPGRGRFAMPVWWRGYGHGVTEAVFVARRGRLTRVHTLVPHAKVQSVRMTQGPWERALGLADIHVDHGANGTATARLQAAGYVTGEVAAQAERSRLGRRAPGPATAGLQAAGYVPGEVAAQAERSRLGRRAAVPDRWLT